jgi:SPP1 gp7 family putative phage head morphogenesis protein
MVPLIFDANAEHTKLLPLVRRNLYSLALRGATSEHDAIADRLASQKQFDADYMGEFDLDASDVVQQFIESIPAAVRARIRQAVDESARQPYWRAIQDNVAGDIAGIIKESIDEGDTPHTMARRIREQLGGPDARRRSKVIARSETTMALNSGHAAAIEDAAQSGLIVGKEWLSIGDDDVRESHVALNGVVVPVKELFDVGGSPAPYPGHWSLPARERVQCRCTCVGAFAE